MYLLLASYPLMINTFILCKYRLLKPMQEAHLLAHILKATKKSLNSLTSLLEQSLFSQNASISRFGINLRTRKISMGSHSNKLSIPDVNGLSQESVFTLVLMILTILSLHFSIKLFQNITATARLINITATWISPNLTALSSLWMRTL